MWKKCSEAVVVDNLHVPQPISNSFARLVEARGRQKYAPESEITTCMLKYTLTTFFGHPDGSLILAAANSAQDC